MTKKQERRQARLKHLLALQRILKIDDILTVASIFDELKRHERRYCKLSTDNCNGDIDGDKFNRYSENVERKVKELIPQVSGLYFNSDPRGYALKIDDKVMRTEYADTGLTKDWGGYGILAPEF